MNINFREQPDSLRSPRASLKLGPSDDKTTYFVCRNNPHPRTVCHIKGLNDVPVCVVRDLGHISGQPIMPRIEQSQNTTRTRTSVGQIFPCTNTSNLQSLTSKRNSFPQPTSYNTKEDISLLSNRTKNTPIFKRKSDLPRKYIPEQSQNLPVLNALAFSPTLALRSRPEIMEDMNYTATYLDYEVKILEKLRDILQTDSLSEIKEWLSKASLNEKEFVSNFIRSDITTRDLLNYHQKDGQSGSEAMHQHLQAMLKGPKAAGPSTGEEKQLRNISQGPRGSIGTRSDKERDVVLMKERDGLFTRGEKIIIPTTDSLPLEHSPSRSRIQERKASPPGIPLSSRHLLHKKARTKQSQHIPEERDPPKKL